MMKRMTLKNLLVRDKTESGGIQSFSESRRLMFHDFDYINPITGIPHGEVPNKFEQTARSIVDFEPNETG